MSLCDSCRYQYYVEQLKPCIVRRKDCEFYEPDDFHEESRWIPVSERSPKKSGNYWCTFGGTNLTGSDYYTTESDAKEFFDEPEEYAGWRSQNVIAWMPLPKPYEPTIIEADKESEDNA